MYNIAIVNWLNENIFKRLIRLFSIELSCDFSSVINITKFYILHILAFKAQSYTVRVQRSGIDTIKYHARPRIPIRKWQTHRSLKICNVRYTLSCKQQNMELYTRNAFKYSFLLSCIERMLHYGLKSQQIVLHANLQSEIVLTIFTILFGVIIFNSL